MRLISIGNSMGIRIPKPIITQARLDQGEFELKVVEEGVLLSPIKKNRQGWAEIAKTHGQQELLLDGPNQFDTEEWHW